MCFCFMAHYVHFNVSPSHILNCSNIEISLNFFFIMKMCGLKFSLHVTPSWLFVHSSLQMLRNICWFSRLLFFEWKIKIAKLSLRLFLNCTFEASISFLSLCFRFLWAQNKKNYVEKPQKSVTFSNLEMILCNQINFRVTTAEKIC